MKKILLSSFLILFAVSSLVLGGTGAFFSDTETSSGNTFTAGAIDLKIDNTSYYNGVLNQGTTWSLTDLTDHLFFDFDDLKPGDIGEDTISIHVDNNDAYVCAEVTLTSNEENGINNPEAEDQDITEGPGEGELAQNVNFIWWADDGDNVLEGDENIISQGPIGNLPLNQPYTVALADSGSNIWTGIGGPVAGSDTKYIGKGWCFGNLSVTPVVQDGAIVDTNPADGIPDNGPDARGAGFSCDGSLLDNTTQTDLLTADIKFSAVQSRHNQDFLCVPDKPPVACELTETYADEVASSDQGLRKNNTAVTADRSDTSYALGAPQSSGTPYDAPVVANSFFSLGFPLLGNMAEIILSFNDNFVVDGPGNDLKLWEVTGGTSYPDEKVDVYVGDSTVGPWTQVGDDVTRDAEIDLFLAGVSQARYVRIVDASNLALFEATADGYDLDAVQALNCIQRAEE
ncbi:MAG: hypothetical protein A3A96_02390 [Candidatus Zambryskibacteria bacterium RIFCSPLOWO2_01_FULL_39_39]|uniref:Uncharacterized protein n=1 Tax=Candidatus Zambryskibacteria bacterium RIFCSPLOWO2_01_FULL_39_39 TaxID=1802758 RepID=A0A1G2TZD2_9BACT|nr:MAG: hypothetical protein A3B88_04150 [Candidatus Zambryskibacteria bacterium RIFCSPHIGHO2_02_FULL_39_19]OHA98290.1 MAG: hypothetical protein A3F20_01840 [Candidatus Zambryskibacteria bacterium RIFCSPHIGHO2_12_FULL_39_21]OHB02676.1 MAG: hypothetical protein A3A96_02390 [Candidatus Zambryskibacteria bacterium RIFCSPLOWO2_01_FULL_39_39]